MKLGFCVACGSADDLQHHHLVTRAEGGSNDETNLITLCCGCHARGGAWTSVQVGAILQRAG